MNEVNYPRWKYHRKLGGRIVNNEEEYKALGPGWCENPSIVKDKSLLVPKVEKSEEPKRVVKEETKPIENKEVKKSILEKISKKKTKKVVKKKVTKK